MQLGLEPGYLLAEQYFKNTRFLYKRFDLEYLVGIEFNTNKLGLGLRYGKSAFPLLNFELKDSEGNSRGDGGYYNVNYQAYLFYIF